MYGSNHSRHAALVGLLMIALAGCAVEVPSTCAEVATYVNGCLGAETYAAEGCDLDEGLSLTSLSCEELSALAESGGKADGVECEAYCAERLNDPERCARICANFEAREAATSSTGAHCRPENEAEVCTDPGGYCQNGYCTAPCEGICPGADTFCAPIEGLWFGRQDPPRAVFEAGGVCVLRADPEYEGALACPSGASTPLWSEGPLGASTTYYGCLVLHPEVSRHVGNSGAVAATADVCYPLVSIDDVGCGQY